MDTNDSGEGPDHGAGATYLLLGPPAVRTSAGLQHVRGRLQSTLFTWLALRAGQPVDSERLIDVLWAEAPPADAVNALQSQVSRLRLLTGTRRRPAPSTCTSSKVC
jgi:DNA-binding SARP family transcriptional activator